MCMKEYGCWSKFKRGDNSTYTFTKRWGGRGGMYLVSTTPNELLSEFLWKWGCVPCKCNMKNERIWSYVKETTSHLQNKLIKNIHLGATTRSSTKWDCLKPIRFHQYTWGLQHFLTFLQVDIGHIKCYWFKISLHHLPNFWQESYSFMHICRQCITTV
jgi:hypothetical protein